MKVSENTRKRKKKIMKLFRKKEAAFLQLQFNQTINKHTHTH